MTKCKYYALNIKIPIKYGEIIYDERCGFDGNACENPYDENCICRKVERINGKKYETK